MRKNSRKTKQEIALALAVSLWIAGGSMAGAEEKTIVIDSDESVNYVYNGTTGDTHPFKVKPKIEGDRTGYNTVIDGGTVNNGVYGGYTKDGNATHNIVNIKNGGWVKEAVYGGVGTGGDANYNDVTLTDSRVDGDVIGGDADDAMHNTITLVRSTVGNVRGGRAYQDFCATYNTVSLTDSTVNEMVFGGTRASGSQEQRDKVTGNALNLYGANTVAGGVYNVENVNLKSARWGTPVLTLGGDGLAENQTAIEALKKARIDASALAFANPENVASGATMNLIQCENEATITAYLAADTTTQAYTYETVPGVTINAVLGGSLAFTDENKALTYTATSNRATKLAFTDVEWKDTGALLDHSTTLTNVDFNGAAVDTTKINFTNIKSLDAGKKMTLVSDFGTKTGTITGTEYTVGTTLKGKGQASLVGSDLIFAAETTAVSSSEDGGNGGGELVLTTQEQTHNTLMGAAAGMAALSAGNDFVGAAAEGISLASNTGADGLATYANMGGGSLRQETGSHVDAHTWNAILAIGHRNAKERSTLDYGAFFEYGRGNYTTINGDQRGDGNTHYTGGGLMAKYTLKDGLYTEASFRAGRMTDNASNVLRDAWGNAYSYKTSTPYYGFHLGVGKVFDLGGGKTVDLYGKYFYNHRNSVSFNAGGQYDLDAVNSQLLRLGARYTLKRDSWNYYAGLAYEYELDGKATGTADGVPIRAASTKGGSLRGELGATFRPSEDSPWNIDLNVSGFAGKKRGVTGGVSVAYMF